MVGEMIIPLLVGIALLFLEYKTGWFAERTPLPDIRPVVNRAKKWLRDTTTERSAGVKRTAEFLIPYIALTINFLLLSPEIRTSSPAMGLIVLCLIALMFMSAGIIKKPIGEITGGLCFIDLILIYGVIRDAKVPSNDNWPATLSDFNMNDPKTLVVIAFMLVFVASWITSGTVTSYFEKETKKFKSTLDILLQSPEIASIQKRVEDAMLKDIQSKWNAFLTTLKMKRPFLADRIYHCVPIGFELYTLKIGCLTKKEVIDITKSSDSKVPPPVGEIQKEFRRFFGNEKMTLSFQVISVEDHEALRKQIL